MKKHLTTILLLLAAIGLAVWLWRDRDSVSEGERRSRENDVFPAWRREDLTRVEIAHEGETIVLVREAKTDSAWRMTSPREERVDQGAVERLTTTLEFARRVRKASDDPKTLGFQAPRASGSVTMGGLAFRFVLGGPSPRPEGSAYLRVDDGAPFVASKELTDALLAPSDTYRDRAVVPYLSLELARFEVRHPGGGFAVQRKDSRSFEVTELGVFAARPALDKVWSALAEMRAEAFPKDADVERLTAKPRLTITMASKEAGKPPAELVVGEACPGHPADVVVLRKTPTRAAACAPSGAMETLLAITPAMLVDHRPFALRHDEIEELRLEAVDASGKPRTEDPKPIEVARRGSGFHEREPVDRELTPEEANAMSELLVQIEKSEADTVTGGNGAPFAGFTARARVRAGEHEETIEVGALGGESVVLRRVRDDARLTVTPAIARRLLPRLSALKPLTLLAETRRVTRVLLRCGAPQEAVDAGKGLRLVDPPGQETDGSLTNLVEALVRGKVLAWVADRDDGSFGIKPDGCRIVLSFADGNTPATVRLGTSTSEGVYGVIDGRPEVFLAGPSLLTLAQRLYVSRASLHTELWQIERVTIAKRGSAPVAGIADAASALIAERALSVGSNDVGPIDVEITITTGDGGPPKRIVCAAPIGGMQRCATPSVKAIFEVDARTIERIFPALPDAGGVDAR